MFIGNGEEWLEFKNSFLTNIYSAAGVSNLQKYQILKAPVKGYPKRLIIQDHYDDQTFHMAWQALCETYNRKKVLVDNHLKAIFNVSPIQKESANQYNKFLHEISGHISNLDGLKISKEILWETSVIFNLSTKLDKHTLRKCKETQ